MKLSIIIPTYNCWNYLKDLLIVLKKQINSDCEVIIVDDGSIDETEKQVQEFLSDNIRYYKKENGGVSSARNYGLDVAKGNYIAFIDSDDLITEDYIKTIYSAIDKNYDYFYISWEAFGKFGYKTIIKDIAPKWNTSVWSRVYKKEIIGNTRFDITMNFAEDEKFNNEILKPNHTHGAIEKVIYFYRTGRPNSLVEQHNTIKTKIVLWQSDIKRIGGIETYLYNLSKQLSKFYDVMVLYKEVHPAQLKRLQKIVRCEKYDPNRKYECEICVLASAWGGYPETLISTKNEYWQFIHAIFRDVNFKYTKWSKTTRHFAVSKIAQEAFIQDQKLPCDLMYNLLDDLQPTKPILKLISATRLTKEKGYDRMVELAKRLKNAGVKFRWTIFTDLEDYAIKPIQMEEVIFMKSRFDLWDYIKEADYGVQLSDTEGWCYFLNECLQYGTPVLSTAFNSVYETVKDGYNGYILNMDLSNLDINKIVNKKPKKFIYTPSATVDNWVELIGEPDKKQNYIPPKIQTVKVIKKYYDMELNKTLEIGTILDMQLDRALYVKSRNCIEFITGGN